MRETLSALCRRFIEDRDLVKSVFSWESSYIYPVCASIFAEGEIRADEERLRQCRDLLKENTGVFSGFRGNLKPVVIAMLASDRNPQGRLEKGFLVYEKLKEHFFTSNYLAMAALVIAGLAYSDKYEEVAKRTRGIYNLMKEEHPFLTSGSDSVFAAMLALSGLSDEEVVGETERCYDILKETFFSSNAVQSLSHVLALYPGSAQEKCEKTVALFQELKDRGYKYGTGYELATLGVLAMLPQNFAEDGKNAVVEDLIEVDAFLSKQKGFGVLGIGRKQRMMHAGLLVVSDYTRRDANDLQAQDVLSDFGKVTGSGRLMSTAVTGSTISLIAAQQATMCAVIAASSSAAASSASG